MQDGVLPGMIKDRYSTYSEGVGKRIRGGKVRQLLLSRNPSNPAAMAES